MNNPMQTKWSHKLRAFLHDPPEKAYDYGPRHQERADIHAAAFKVPVAELPSKHPDWGASAADRFIFPKGAADCAWAQAWLSSSVRGRGRQNAHFLAGRGRTVDW
jgi:hypothetical protein